jgi:hypothetical protein
MNDPLRILFVTDAFPPGSGGSGWSTYYLARMLNSGMRRIGRAGRQTGKSS